MGYTTKFQGRFEMDKLPTAETIVRLRKLMREALQQAEKLIMSNVDPAIDGPGASDTFTQAAAVVIPMIRAALTPESP